MSSQVVVRSDHRTLTFTFLPPLCPRIASIFHRWLSSSHSMEGSASFKSWWYLRRSTLVLSRTTCLLTSLGQFSCFVPTRRCGSVSIKPETVVTLLARVPNLSDVRYVTGLDCLFGNSGWRCGRRWFGNAVSRRDYASMSSQIPLVGFFWWAQGFQNWDQGVCLRGSTNYHLP